MFEKGNKQGSLKFSALALVVFGVDIIFVVGEEKTPQEREGVEKLRWCDKLIIG